MTCLFLAAALLLPGAALAQVKTFYVINGTANGFGALQEGGTAPGTANLAAGWTTARGTAGRMSPLAWGVEQTAATFTNTVEPDAAPNSSIGDALRTQSAYSGTFANTAWTIRQAVIANTAQNTNALRLRYRVLASTDPTGATGLRELTAATLVTGATAINLLTTTAQNLTVTWNPGAITLANEYLFFELACEIVTRGAGTGTTQDILLRTDATNSLITTPVFTATVPVTSVSVSPTTATIAAGGTQAISATALPATATNRNVSWTTGAGCDASDSVSPATTVGNGTATTTFTAGTGGTFPRSCQVTATAADGSGFSATSTITINAIPVTGVSVSPTTATITAGGTQALSATALPANATNRSVSWTKVSGCDAADALAPATTVGNGTATTTFTASTGGAFPRTCVVRATAADGSGFSATSSITISAIPVASVSVAPATATISAGGTAALSATALPANATNRNVSWTKGAGCDAGDSVSPATTAGDGLATTTFTASAGGTLPRTCVVTATAADGSGASDTASITVNPVLVTGVTVSPATATIQGGATQALSATALPATATNRNVSWTKVSGCDAGDTIGPATTLGNGVATTTFTAFAGGTYPRTCVVRATAADGSGFAGDSSITVTAVPVASVSVSPGTATVVAGGTQALSATALPAGATNRNVSWTKVSGCDAADSVSPASTLGNGVAETTFTASAGGTLPRSCVLRATAADGGGAFGETTVTVNPIAVTGVTISPTSASVQVSTTQQFTATVAPANATNPAVGWSVLGGAGCGAVNATGLYTAPASVAAGCSVRVTTVDGGRTADATLTITPARSVAIGDASTAEASSTVLPGAAKIVLDAFTLAASEGTATPSSVTVTLPAGSSALLNLLTIENTSACNQGTPYGAVNPASDVVTVPVSALTVGTSAVPLWVCIQPRSHAAMPPPPGSQVAVTGQVTGVAAPGYAQSGGDVASPARTIDNLSPNAPSAFSGAAGNGQVTLSWGAPAGNAQVVLLRWARATPGAEVPAEGQTPDYAVGNVLGTAVVACVEAAPATGCIDTNVVNGGTYVYRAFSRDAALNWSVGAQAGPYYPSGPFVAEGSTVVGAPMISIVNPLKGSVVSGQFRVQMRVSSAGGIAGVSGLAYSLNDGASWDTTGITSTTAYDVTTAGVVTGRMFEVRLNPAPGSYTLRARVSNALASNVLSNGVPVVAKLGGTGDGNLLVRDNSSQLCADCHAHKGHTSESTESQRGSWSTTCRDCHTPHGTRNVSLIAEQITPPQITAQQGPKTVTYYGNNGFAPNSYASPAADGPCQVCHTRTKNYRADGTDLDPNTGLPVPSGSHYPSGACVTCHKHTDGLASSCSGCHGDAGRASIEGADSLQTAAPPVVDPNAIVSVAGGGAHLAHVNLATWRSAPLRCVACHPQPNAHQATTDVSWSALATTGAVTVFPANGALDPAWPSAPSCTNWCHGAGLAGGGGTLKGVGPARWTDTSAPCGSCHASPPPLGGGPAFVHPQNTSCAACHGAGYAEASVGAAAKAVHVDGTVQKPQNGCTACHGVLAGLSGAIADRTSLSAMPGFDPGLGASIGSDTHGSTARAAVGVGAHDAHARGRYVAPQDCAVCHGLKPADGDRAHADGVVRFGYGAVPSSNGVATAPSAFDAAFQASPSCTNYCHSTGKPVGLAATPTPVTWTSTSAMDCTSCHAAAGMATHAHAKHVATQGVDCQACHAATTDDGASIVTGGGLHVDAQNDVEFTLTDPFWSGFFSVGSQYEADRTCASTYCHSNGTSTGSPFGAPTGAALAWNAGSGSATCTSCHGGPDGATVVIGVGAGNGTARHQAHVSNATALGTNYPCGACHQATVAATSSAPVTNAANHANRLREVSIANRGPRTSTNPVGGSCSAVYCHSSGQATPVYVPVTWTGGSPLACNGCHGTGNATGAPDYTQVGPPGGADANTHGKHTSFGTNPASCQNCHYSIVNATADALFATSHTNGYRDVLIAPAFDTNGATTNYNPVAKACASVSCHGNKTPVWGATLGCTDCHGKSTRGSIPLADANQTAAPPDGANGEALESDRAVGEHVAHVNQASLRSAPLACAECHAGNTHNNTDETGWGALASSTARAIGWNGTTCSNTYCHAPGLVATDIGGSDRSPSWTSLTTVTCASCHGAPPPANATAGDHPANASCATCHGAGYTSPVMGAAAKGTHVNGHSRPGFDRPRDGCTACHGVLAGVAGAPVANTSTTAAPGAAGTGVDTTGATAGARVGAHRAHLEAAATPKTLMRPVVCTECHSVPAAGNTAHADGGFGEVDLTIGTLARAGAQNPLYTRPNCASVYCHGDAYTAPDYVGSVTTLTWTTPNGATCGSCHKAPPLTHSTSNGDTNCNGCHAGYDCVPNLSASCTLPANHINGVGEGPSGCAGCHGTSSRTAQQAGVLGAGETGEVLAGSPPNPTVSRTAAQTGVHLSHVYPSSVAQTSTPVRCYECHSNIAAYTDSNHGGDNALDVSFLTTGKARLTGFAASWTQGTPYPNTAGTCATYCHGSSFSASVKGSVSSWGWNDATVATCASCHKTAPADGPHVSKTSRGHTSTTWCVTCHPGTSNATGTIVFTGTGASATTVHIDGTVQRTVTCTSCHGNPPTVSPDQLASVTNVNAVGAHAAHSTGTPFTITAPYDCNGCHVKPASTPVVNVTHADGGTPEMAFTTLAPATAWSDSGSSCATSYCHGNTTTGNTPIYRNGVATGTNTSATQNLWGGTTVGTPPVWTTVNGTFRACTSCHGAPPTAASADHPANTTCDHCHPAGATPTGGATPTAITSGSALRQNHVDGHIDVLRTGCAACHGDSSQNAVAGGGNPIAAAPGALVGAGPSRDTRGSETGTRVGAHRAHLQAAGSARTLMSRMIMCNECHTVPATGTVHADIGPDVVLAGTVATGNGSYSPTYAQPNCSSLYCHGQGYAADANYAGSIVATGVARLAWTAGTNGATCGSCHKAPPSTSGHPAATVNANTNCQGCHPGYNCVPNTSASCVLPANHINGVGEGPSSCLGCHGTAADSDDFTATLHANSVKSTFNTTEWTYSGHGKTAGSYDQSVRPAANFPTTPEAGKSECLYCHDDAVAHNPGVATNPYRLRGVSTGGTTAAWTSANPNAVCLNCHDSASAPGVTPAGQANKKAAAAFSNGAHFGAKHAAGEGGKFCWDCHEPHGDRASNTTAAGQNIYMIRSQVFQTNDGTYGHTPTLKNVTFNSVASGGPALGRMVEATTATRLGICQACHDPAKATTQSTKYWRWNGTDDPDGAAGAAAYTSNHNSTETDAKYCLKCHPHDDDFKGKGTCISCHGSATTGAIPRAKITGGLLNAAGDDFIRPSRHVSNGTATSIVTNYDCILCHTEGSLTSSGSGATENVVTDTARHGNDGGTTTVDLRNVDSPGGTGLAVAWTGSRGAPLAKSATHNAVRRGMDTFCLNCHDSNGASTVAVNKNNPANGMLYGATAPTLAQAQKPFNYLDNTYNSRESTTHPLRALRTKVVDVKSQFNTGNLAGPAFASHHNLDGYTKRYTGTWLVAGTWTSYVTKEGLTMSTAREAATFHCSDCHLNETNAHGTRNTWFMLSNSTDNDVAFANQGATNATDICSKCHNPAVYQETGTGTGSNTDGHQACPRVGDYPAFARLTSSDGAVMPQIPCLGCHGGYQFGSIHGTNETYQPFGTGTATKKYRFMGTGASYRYYSPNTTNAVTDPTTWNGTTNGTCYLISSTSEQWGGCAQHQGGKNVVRRGRTLNY